MRATEHSEAGAPSQAPSSTQYINLLGYRFLPLEHLPVLQADLHRQLAEIGILGTILLADEGINIALSGTAEQCRSARDVLNADPRFRDIWLKESVSSTQPFSKLKVRIRHEIIAFDGAQARTRQLERPHAPSLSPEEVAQWLESNKDVALLDTRNTYEVESGTFKQAQQLNIAHFRDFQRAVKEALESGALDVEKPVITFCTGGIRCEKAAPWMIEQGFKEVYQIEGGIFNYFEKTGGTHWDGNCFVFDDRVEVDKQLRPTGASWCTDCQLTVQPGQQCVCQSSRTAIEMV